ncbi:MAG: DUF1549 domain-containing protein [Pirellulaceae bacterium]
MKTLGSCSTYALARLLLGLVCLGAIRSAGAAPPQAAQEATAESRAAAEASAPLAVKLNDHDWDQASRREVLPDEIDGLIAEALGDRRIDRPPLTTDEQFLRRVSLDLTGRPPTPEAIAEFVSDARPDKRALLIDRLLASDDFARHWARYWRDVVTARLTLRRTMGLTRSFEEWLFEQFRSNRSWGEITEAILTAEGELRFTLNTPASENGNLFFLVAHDGPEAEERAAETSRVFLGIQIQCAQCHDHLTEKWKRRQFHEFAAYFARIKYEQLFDAKKLSGVQLVRLEDREHLMEVLGDPEQKQEVHPRFLDGDSPGEHLGDRERRQALARRITSHDNHWFAAAHVNRVWRHLMGWSFYQHVDDLGENKEVIYPAVLTRLTGSFRGSDYDIKALFRAIMNSQTYQLQQASKPPESGYAAVAAIAPRRLRPDALWDSLTQVLGRIEPGYRFHTQSGVRFNQSFVQGRFQAEFDTDPSADNDSVQGTIPQSLLMMNEPKLNARIAATRTTLLGEMLTETEDDAEALNRLYLTVLSRSVSDRERDRCLAYLKQVGNRNEAFEDILWALVNSTEFQMRR